MCTILFFFTKSVFIFQKGFIFNCFNSPSYLISVIKIWCHGVPSRIGSKSTSALIRIKHLLKMNYQRNWTEPIKFPVRISSTDSDDTFTKTKSFIGERGAFLFRGIIRSRNSQINHRNKLRLSVASENELGSGRNMINYYIFLMISITIFFM